MSILYIRDRNLLVTRLKNYSLLHVPVVKSITNDLECLTYELYNYH
jgi:hypothetical protein